MVRKMREMATDIGWQGLVVILANLNPFRIRYNEAYPFRELKGATII